MRRTGVLLRARRVIRSGHRQRVFAVVMAFAIAMPAVAIASPAAASAVDDPAAAAAPFVSAPSPAVTGTGTAGSTLTAVVGTWSPKPTTLTYQWLRNGTPISGATKKTYTLVAADRGTGITVTTTGTKGGYITTSRTSAAKKITTIPFKTAPIPTVTGSAKVGATLTASAGMWSPAPTTVTYQWYRNGTAITDATAKTYALATTDGGTSLTVRVIAKRSGYTSTARTSAAKKIPALAFKAAPIPTLSGAVTVGSTLTANAGTWTPTPATLTYQWYRNGAAITGATASSYKLTSKSAGTSITVRVVGKKPGYTSTARISAAKNVPLSFALAPVPKVSGTAAVGSTVTATAGKWTPTPNTLTYQWYRDGTAISGKTAKTYKVIDEDAGTTLTVRVVAKRSGYASTAKTSTGTPIPSAGDRFTVAPVPTITGTGQQGTTLQAVPGNWSPLPFQILYQWYRDGEPIDWANSVRYTPGGADIGHSLTLKTTAVRDGYASMTRTSSAIAITCGPPTTDGRRYLTVNASVTKNTRWSTQNVDVVRICEMAVPGFPQITADATATVDPGVTVELYTTLRVEGSLNLAGTAEKPVTVKTGLGGALESALSSGTLKATHIQAPTLSIHWMCGSISVSDSTFYSLSSVYGYVAERPTLAACERSQGTLEITDSQILHATSNRFAVEVSDWAGDISFRGNSVASNVYIFQNRGPSEMSDVPNSSSSAVILGNTVSGPSGLAYSDDCEASCSIGAQPLVYRDNHLTSSTAKFSIFGATLTDGSISGNIGPNADLYQYGGITASGHLTLPLPHEGRIVKLATAASAGSLYIPAGATVDVKAGSTVSVANIWVGGTLRVADEPATVDTVINSSALTFPQWGLGVAAGGTAEIVGAELRGLRSVSLAGDLSILDSKIVDPTGVGDNNQDPMRYDRVPSVIRQTAGNLYLDAEYIRTPRLLKQFAGSAIVRGKFVDARADISLIQTCEWEEAKCFVDARDVDWGTPDGPFSQPKTDDPFEILAPNLFCGTGLVWSWVGSTPTDAGQWPGGCDGIDHRPEIEIAEAQENYDSSLQRFLANCESDPEEFASACAVVASAHACLNSAMNLAQQSSTFPLALAEDEDNAKKIAEGAIESLEALDKPSLRIPVAAAGLALQAGSVYSTLSNVKNAYAQCAP